MLRFLPACHAIISIGSTNRGKTYKCDKSFEKSKIVEVLFVEVEVLSHSYKLTVHLTRTSIKELTNLILKICVVIIKRYF